jgi:hypothetical protein
MTAPVPISKAQSCLSKTVELNEIKLPKALLSYLNINPSILNEYIWAIACGMDLPNLPVFFDGCNYWLANDIEIWEAARHSNFENLNLSINPGTERDAILFACKLNTISKIHPALIGDQKRAIGLLLNDPEWREWSNLQIANHCGVDELSVAIFRQKIYLC